MSRSWDYDHAYSPPAPVIEVTLVARGPGARDRTLPALVDTGANDSLFALDELLAVGAEFINQRWLRGITGARLGVDVYRLSVEVAGVQIHALKVGGVAGLDENILGRDALQELRVLLDGPGEAIEVST